MGWGFRPWRAGGLIAYAEDLMSAQVRRGHAVAYFFSGRHYPFPRTPRLKAWRRGGVAMYEALNAPIVFGAEHGTRAPEHDLCDPWLEDAFARVLRERRPDVVHVQELAGLPSSLLEHAARAGVPVLMTLQDYLPLCATMRLYDSAGDVCLRRDVGADCAVNNAGAPAGAGPLISRTLHFELQRAKRAVPAVRRLSFAPARPAVDAAVAAATRLARRDRPPGPAPAPHARPGAYQRRREVNVERLRRVDALVAQSHRVEEIYRRLGVDGDNLRTLTLTLGHLERLRPRTLTAPPRPVTFAAIDACAAPSKGLDVVLDALRRLSAAGADGGFRLLVLGHVAPDAHAELARHPSVTLHGVFAPGDLDAILDGVDVGLVPSVWEEAYGFVGMEFLAKGIPLIANRIGGIVDYARPGETAWLNDSRTGEGLAELMLAAIRAPERVVELHRSVVARRTDLVKGMDEHAAEMDALYGELVS